MTDPSDISEHTSEEATRSGSPKTLPSLTSARVCFGVSWGFLALSIIYMIYLAFGSSLVTGLVEAIRNHIGLILTFFGVILYFVLMFAFKLGHVAVGSAFCAGFAATWYFFSAILAQEGVDIGNAWIAVMAGATAVAICVSIHEEDVRSPIWNFLGNFFFANLLTLGACTILVALISASTAEAEPKAEALSTSNQQVVSGDRGTADIDQLVR